MGGPERDEQLTVPARPASRDAPAREATRPVESAFDPGDGRFEARGELGRGGMGRVDDAYDRALGRPVAIKHMLSAEGVDLARFEREARITARLEHPGIVPIHDAGRGPDGTPYYVMRRVDGQPLSELVAGKSLAERLALIPNVLAACDAAAFAHARQVVHRDIKPTNILVGPFGETLLIDWGLARELGEGEGSSAAIPASDPKLTRAGTVAGTPGFMAPEQARGESVDVRADVFALGATLFYALAGQLPYGEGSATEVVNLVGNDRPPDWKRIPDQVAPDLKAIVMKAMALDPRERYGDAGALAADLRRFVTGNLVGAYEYGTLARLRRFVRRHRAAVAVGLVSALVLALVGVLSVRRVVEERDAATAARALAEQRQRDALDAAERQLLQRAREALDRDPTATVLMLRELRPDSRAWPQAATIAQAAALRGIPFGFTGEQGDHPVFSPDGEHLAVTSPSGALRICTLASPRCTELGSFGRLLSVGWLDRGHHVAVTAGTRLVDVDIDTGDRRERRIAEGAVDMFGRGDGTLLVRYDDRIDILDRFDATPRVFLAGRLDFDNDGQIFVSDHGVGVEVWTRAGRHWVLDAQRKASNIVARDIVVSFGDDLAAWRITDAGPIALGRWKLDDPTYAVADRDGLLVSTLHGVVRVGPRGVVPVVSTMNARATTSGDGRTAFVASEDGTIHVYEDNTGWQIGPRGVRYQSLYASQDGRYLVAVAHDGALLLWDLDSFRPRVHTVTDDAHLVTVFGSTVVLASLFDVYTQDLATGKTKAVLSREHNMVGPGWLDPSGTMIGIAQMRSGQDFGNDLLVVDPVRWEVLGEIGKDEAQVYSSAKDGFVVAHGDGAVELWSNRGRFTRQPLTKLDRRPDIVMADRDRVLAVYDHDLVRVDLHTNSTLRMPFPAQIDEIVLEPSGILVLAGGVVWRWDGRWAPRLLPVPGRVLHIYPGTAAPLVRTSSSLVMMTDPPVVITSQGDSMMSPSNVNADASSEWIAMPAGPTGLVLADLGSQIAFTLHAAGAMDAVVVDDRRVFLQILGGHIQEWDLRVPTEPAALRTWLDTVTNAKGLPDSDAVLWP